MACLIVCTSLTTSLPYGNARDTNDYISERYDDESSIQQKDKSDLSQNYNDESRVSETEEEDPQRISENDKRAADYNGASDSFIDDSQLNWTTEDNWAASGSISERDDTDASHEKKSHSHYVEDKNNVDNV